MKVKIFIAAVLLVAFSCKDKFNVDPDFNLATLTPEPSGSGYYTLKGIILGMDKIYLKDHGFFYAANDIPNFNSPNTKVAHLGTLCCPGPMNYSTSLTAGEYYQIRTFAITTNNDTISGPAVLYLAP